MNYTKKQIEHIKENCSIIDIEQKYRDLLDDSPVIVVAGISFNPSRVLEELDPIAFNCYSADFSDSEGFEEIEGDYYSKQDIESCLEELEESEESEG